MEAMVIRALASAQGIAAASRGTAALERRPTPPPHTTKRTKEERGLGVEGCGTTDRPGSDRLGSDRLGSDRPGSDRLGIDGRCDSMTVSFRAGLSSEGLSSSRCGFSGASVGLQPVSTGLQPVSTGFSRDQPRPTIPLSARGNDGVRRRTEGGADPTM
ncbi:hypothetical protein AQJ67_23605 [Streptomyces caeruleatus]|uniref:Uncharacterized protein n=1 Tax=Streptomyces caeruleatus TaxID=661399 RepID=A0A124I8S4_9ACTN|nr:hypothetical protein AQJ67_23605 [Streptomyces caeruleatus]